MTPEEYSIYLKNLYAKRREEEKAKRKAARLIKNRERNKKDRENLTDDYVKHLLAQQFKDKSKNIPEELLDVKRAIVKIRRLKRKANKMLVDIVKTCMHHGPLTISQVNKNGNKLRCKQCQRDAHANHYKKHKQKVSDRQKKYRQENKEHHRQVKYRSWLKNKHKHVDKAREYKKKFYWDNHAKVRERENLRRRRCTILLTDGYIKRVSRGRDLTPEEIEKKKKNIILYRKKNRISCTRKLKVIENKLRKLK